MFTSVRIIVFGLILLTTESVLSSDNTELLNDDPLESKREVLQWLDDVYKTVNDEELFNIQDALSRQFDQLERRSLLRRSDEKEDNLDYIEQMDEPLSMSNSLASSPNSPSLSEDPPISLTLEELHQQIMNVRDVVDAAIILMDLLRTRFNLQPTEEVPTWTKGGTGMNTDSDEKDYVNYPPSGNDIYPDETTERTTTLGVVNHEPDQNWGMSSMDPSRNYAITTELPKENWHLRTDQPVNDLELKIEMADDELSYDETISKSNESQMPDNIPNIDNKIQNKMRRLQQIKDCGKEYLNLLETEKNNKQKEIESRRISQGISSLVMSMMRTPQTRTRKNNIEDDKSIKKNTIENALRKLYQTVSNQP
ncbi:unnamed protein product [Diamesa serratosioi]